MELAQLAGEAGFITGTALTMVSMTLVVSDGRASVASGGRERREGQQRRAVGSSSGDGSAGRWRTRTRNPRCVRGRAGGATTGEREMMMAAVAAPSLPSLPAVGRVACVLGGGVKGV